MITIMGATGHVGHRITEALLDGGARVRALGRDEHRGRAIAARGAQFVRSGIDADLAQHFAGSDAVFVMLPHNPRTEDFAAEQSRWGRTIVDAVRESGVRRVVALSSLGADRPDAPGILGCLAAQERRLRSLPDCDIMLLRPVSFFENLCAAIEQVTSVGVHVDSVDPELRIPMIATADIAAAGVSALTEPSWTGVQTEVLLGERDISYSEATTILGRALGVPDARYDRVPDANMVEILTSIGFSRSYAQLYVDMTGAFNTGELTAAVPRTNENSTATSFEQFAATLTPNATEPS